MTSPATAQLSGDQSYSVTSTIQRRAQALNISCDSCLRQATWIHFVCFDLLLLRRGTLRLSQVFLAFQLVSVDAAGRGAFGAACGAASRAAMQAA